MCVILVSIHICGDPSPRGVTKALAVAPARPTFFRGRPEQVMLASVEAMPDDHVSHPLTHIALVFAIDVSRARSCGKRE